MTFPAPVALKLAEWLVGELTAGCSQVQIAGSLRRGKLEVKDIEIVAMPAHQPDLFGGEGFDRLNETLLFLTRSKKIEWRGRQGGLSSTPPDLDGRKFYAIAIAGKMPDGSSIHVPVDLFAVRPPAQWGAILAIRTGPAEFSQRLVTTCQKVGLRCHEGHLERTMPDGEVAILETPTEREFIERCGVVYQEPANRR